MSDVTDVLWRHLAGRAAVEGPREEFLARLAVEAPVATWGGFHVVSGFAPLRTAAADPALRMASPRFRDAVRAANPEFTDFFSGSMSVRPAPDHRRLRAVLVREFSGRRLARLEADVDVLARDLVEAAARRGHSEFVADVALPLPVHVTARLLGLPRADWDAVRTWAEGLLSLLSASFLSDEQRARRTGASPITPPAFRELRAYVDDLLRTRRPDPDADDLVSRLLVAHAEGRCSYEELADLILLLFMTGVDTVTSALSNIVLCTLQRSEIWSAVLRDPEVIPEVVAESLRVLTPVAFGAREAAAPTVVGGRPVAAGDVVTLAFAAANLDATAFEAPLEFRWGRPTHAVPFGHGTYFCVGSALGAAQGASVLRALREVGTALAPGADAVTWRQELAFNSPSALHLTLGHDATQLAGARS